MLHLAFLCFTCDKSVLGIHGSLLPKKQTESPNTLPCVCLVAQSCLTLCNPMDCSPPGSSVHEDSPGKNTGVGCHALLRGIFPNQGSNPGLPYCRWILYQLSHQGSQPIPSPGDLPNPGIKPGSPALPADSLPTELSGKPIKD